MFIERITQMLALRHIQDRNCNSQGQPPFNVSSWLISESYSKALEELMVLPSMNSFDYMYTYSLDKTLVRNVLEKMDPSHHMQMGITFFDNGTQAIVMLVNMIRQMAFKKIAIINPAYFSIAQTMEAFGLTYDSVDCIRTEEGYALPFEGLLESKYDVIWFTSPVFSTSMYPSDETVSQLQSIMDQGTLIIFDECFCVPGNELLKRFNRREQMICIYSPHKALCINTVKFAALVYPIQHDLFFEHWVDVLSGNLPASSIQAIKHYISPNFDLCLRLYKEQMGKAIAHVKTLVASVDDISYDPVEIGSLMTLYFKKLSFEQSISHQFFETVLKAVGYAYYPSFLNGLNEGFGFAFRINLALYDEKFVDALTELTKYLTTGSVQKKGDCICL